MNASKEGHAEVVEALLEAGAQVEHRDIVSGVVCVACYDCLIQGAWTALVWASYKGWTAAVDVLLRHNANPNVKEEVSDSLAEILSSDFPLSTTFPASLGLLVVGTRMS